ncbi:PH domain-containing protein [Hyperthermus butylicus]|uniref:Bacterial Pleckstrin homology domain-containing protein n=1 Tax=Hyperthermus butylicus (strain DSM 5456 / JCM 9403 / PLM1-5) TaxID=415426 RepID=A2BJK7_HYPBU|nr:PH domain-containing protein [Hyperthermus butylicus]ABM80168.1 hypothetical protein Hbut_0296 [Hyperthermus butylicus DSM 5456]
MAYSDTVLRIALSMVATPIVVVVIALTGLPPCPPAAVAFAAGLGLLVVVLPALLVFLPRICRVRASLDIDTLHVDMGSCGVIEIPLDAIRSVRVVDKVVPVWRLAGTSLPGFYSGLFEVKGYGRAYIYAERLENLLALELANGRTVFVGGNAPELADKLEGLVAGSSRIDAENAPRLQRERARIMLLALAAVVVMGAVLGAIAYAALPDKVPVDYGSNWEPEEWGSKTSLLAIYYAIVGGSAAVAAILLVAKRDPTVTLIMLPTVAGLILLGAALLFAAPCYAMQ